MDDCLNKDLAQCEAVCTDPLAKTENVGLACNAAATKYQRANPPDWEHAIQLLDHACTGGANEVCVSIGNRYMKGQDVKRDLGKAQAYFKKACDNNYKPGCDSMERLDQINAIVFGRDGGADAASPQ